MTTKLPKISVDEAKFQVIAHLTLDDVLAHRDPPNELIGEARLRIAALKSAGHIEDFIVYEQDIATMWRKLQRRKTLQSCDLILAAGFPRLNGFSIDTIGEGRSKKLAITVTAPRFVARRWRPEWLFAYARKRALDLGYAEPINFPQLHFLWARQAINGESCILEPMLLARHKPQAGDKTSPSIVLKASKGWVQLSVASPKACDISAETITTVRKRIKRQVRKLASAPGGSGYYVFFDEYTSGVLNALATSPQRYGLALPQMWLCGFRGTDQPYPDDVIRGLPKAFPYLLTTVFREMMRLGDSSFLASWFISKLAYPLNDDMVQSLMNILRARNIVTQDDEGRWILSKDLRYVGYKVSSPKPGAFAVAAAKIAVSMLAEKTAIHGDGHIFALSEAQQGDLVAAVRGCRERIVKIARSSKKLDSVIQVNLCFFPLTKQNKAEAHLEPSALISPDTHGKQLTLLASVFGQLDAFKRDEHWMAAKLILPLHLAKNKSSTTNPRGIAEAVFDSEFVALLFAELMEFSHADRGESSFIVIACHSAVIPLIQLELAELKDELVTLARQSKGKDQVYAWSSVVLSHSST